MPRKSESPTRRRGPKPLLTMAQETELAQWILSQQSSGQRVSRNDVVLKAQEMVPKDENQDQDQNETKQTQKLGMGWCNRFMTRHPELNLRSAITNSTTLAPNLDATVNVTLCDTITDSVDEESETLDTIKHLETKQDAGQPEKPIKTRKYNRKHMEAAVEMYLAGRSMSDVTQRFPLLHQRTIRRRVLRVQRGEVDKRRGPRPLLEGEPEQELVAWILDMQNRGTKVTKNDILARANEQYRVLTGEKGENRLKDGWLRRFKERHPVLSGRAPSSARNEGENSSDEDKFTLTGDDELANNAQPTEEQQEIEVLEAEEKREIQEVNFTGTEDTVPSPKRQKTEGIDNPMTLKSTSSGTGTRCSNMSEKQQSGMKSYLLVLECILLRLVSRVEAATLTTSCSRVCGEYEQCFIYNGAEYCAQLCAPGRCSESETCILRGVVPCTREPCLPEAVCEPQQSPIVNEGRNTPTSSCKLNCQLVSSPVCGSNDVSYANSCFLKEAKCMTGNQELVVSSRGLCDGEKALNAEYNPLPTLTPSSNDACLATTTCADVLDPVCTSAGTMRNLCYFNRIQRCSQSTVTLIRSGSCEDTNVMPLCPATCTDAYSPVCASNGQLYGNECLFRQA
ncbi:Hypothetical protein PHPALM_10742, partial [Phytophthora palmivora]